MGGLLRGTSEKTYEEQYTLLVAIFAPAERNYCKSQSDDSGTVRNVIRAFLIRRERIYGNFAYSALAAFKMGISGSASFQSVKKSL
jgi:hypothetical protein